jgi:hypothetical protein
MKKVIRIVLDDDTAAFLERAHDRDSSNDASDFINSLLRQEQFRQGYPSGAFGDLISRHPVRSNKERLMLERSGLLPFPHRRR